MVPKLDERTRGLLAIAARSSHVRLTADGQVALGPGFLLAWKPETSDADADFQVYDNVSADGDILVGFHTVVGEGNLYSHVWPLPFSKGLYLSGASNITAVTFHFVLERNLERD